MTKQIATVVSLPRDDKFCNESCTAKRSNLIKKCAFTLAEVLITLGIIGVVAALTLPTVVKNYQKHVTINRLKSAYTIINNAIEMAKSDYGNDIKDWYIPYSNDSKLKTDYFTEHYLIPYLKVVKDCNHSNTNDCRVNTIGLNGTISQLGIGAWRLLKLSNGQAIVVFVGGVSLAENQYNSRIEIALLINGNKSLNQYGKDLFMIEFGGIKGTEQLNKFLPYAHGVYNDRNKYLTVTHSYGCNKNAIGSGCFSLILFDGWQIAKDYPW